MDIKLYNILGLSRTDTLYFTDIYDQVSFYNNNIVTSIESTFYPPHYTNKIRIDITEYAYLPTINYLSFEYLNMVYYYFIDSINYINDSVLELNITMDTIQTYMFKMTIYNAHVERALINRFKYGENEKVLINRDYERENYSRREHTINRKVLSTGKYWLVVKLLKQPTSVNYWTKAPINNVVMSTGYLFALIPLFNCKLNTDIGIIDYDANSIGLEYIKVSEDIENIYIIDDLFIQQAYNYDNVYYDFVNSNFKGRYYPILNTYTGNYGILLEEIPSLEIKQPYTIINAIPVNDTKTAFSYTHVPYVIDDNYISINYGENISKTSISPSLIEVNSITFKGYYDIETGSRAYQILIDNKDTQETTQLVTTCENFSMLTNAYNQYISRNIGTATIGQATKLINSAVQVASGSIAQPISNAISSATTLINLKNTPNQEKQANNVNLDIASSNLAINFEINYNTSELQEVAKIVESRGYKVNSNYVHIGKNINKDIFTTYKTRYYFNYIKTTDINLDIEGINDIETINNIRQRFNEGFRYWTSETYNIMNPNTIFKYDNVEIDNL